MTDLQALRQQYKEQKAALLQQLQTEGATTRGIHGLLTRLARLVDELLADLWQRAGFPEAFALAAVGGYGRGELFPYSDVDVLVLLPDSVVADSEPELKSRLEAFIGSCWDVGLEIGSSVRTLSECVAEAGKDVTVQTSLLEARLLIGPVDLFAAFQQAFRAHLDPQAFFVAKSLELRQRHNKSENTPYSLEPNCKESPGGLFWRHLGRPRHQWAGHALRGAPDQEQRGLAEPDPGPAARGGQAARRPARVRPADRGGRDLRLPVACARWLTAGRAGQRGPDAPLLLGRQGGLAAAPDPDAQHRRAPAPQHPRAAPHQRALLREGRHDRGGQ